MGSQNTFNAVSILLVAVLLLVSCSSRQDSSVEFEYGGQEFRIIPAYEGQARYVKEASGSSESYEVLWRENVIEPYRDECLSGEYEEGAEYRVARPILDFTRLSDSVELLRKSDVEELVEQSLRESTDALPGSDTSVCIFVAGDYDVSTSSEESTGVGGFASGSDKLLILLDPQRDWQEWTPYYVAHEYHHTVWTSENTDEARTLDLATYLVFEGRADSFAHELYPRNTSPFTDALSAAEEREQWKKMKSDLDNTDQNLLLQYAFGGPESPPWTLYTIGYDIVQSYIEENPEVSTEELLRKEPKEIIAESGYDGR